jgi:hypothetical protein
MESLNAFRLNPYTLPRAAQCSIVGRGSGLLSALSPQAQVRDRGAPRLRPKRVVASCVPSGAI